MCLMCEYYYDDCNKPECVAAARQRAEDARGTREYTVFAEEYWASRFPGRLELFLWKGYSDGPCEHIRARHTEDCNVVIRKDSVYGTVYGDCDCEYEL